MKGTTAKIETLAAQHVAAGEAATLEEGIQLAIARDPTLYGMQMIEGNDIMKQQVKASAPSPVAQGSQEPAPHAATASIEARAHTLVQAGHAADFDDAVEQIMSEPDAYNIYLQTLPLA